MLDSARPCSTMLDLLDFARLCSTLLDFARLCIFFAIMRRFVHVCCCCVQGELFWFKSSRMISKLCGLDQLLDVPCTFACDSVGLATDSLKQACICQCWSDLLELGRIRVDIGRTCNLFCMFSQLS